MIIIEDMLNQVSFMNITRIMTALKLQQVSLQA